MQVAASQLVDNLQQAGKIHKLQHVCGTCDCVRYAQLFGIIDKCQKAHHMTVNVGLSTLDVSLAFATTSVVLAS